jgi:hypothetical protein
MRAAARELWGFQGPLRVRGGHMENPDAIAHPATWASYGPAWWALRSPKRSRRRLTAWPQGARPRTVNSMYCRLCSPCCSRFRLRSVRLRHPCHRDRVRYAGKPSRTEVPEGLRS